MPIIIGVQGGIGVRQPLSRPTESNSSDAARAGGDGSIRLAGSGRSFLQILSRVPPEGRPSRPDATNSLRAIAEHALRAEKTVDALIAAATRGRTFTAAELIALQATVFRYSQTVEVISRATDRLIGSVKQTLGTQV